MAEQSEPGEAEAQQRLRVLEGLIPLLRERARSGSDSGAGASLWQAASRDTLRNTLNEAATLYEIAGKKESLAAVLAEIASLLDETGVPAGVEVGDTNLHEAGQHLPVADGEDAQSFTSTKDLTGHQARVVGGSESADVAGAHTADSFVSTNNLEQDVDQDMLDERVARIASGPGEADAKETVLCSHCGRHSTAALSPSFGGLRVITCPECGKSTHYPLTPRWRSFWWVFAILTAATGVSANVLLHQGFSWIPNGVGILSFVMLFWDVGVRYRLDQASRAALASAFGVEQNASSHRTQAALPDSARPAYVAALAATATMTVLVSVLGALVVTGLNAGYDTEIMDRAAGSATLEFAGFDLVEGEADICRGGQDYWACTAMHNTMWNSLCTGAARDRTAAAQGTCDRLGTFIDDAWTRYATCGYGCETRTGDSGRWGWRPMRPSPTFVKVPGESEVTHVESCHFVLGPIQMGYCPRSS